MAQLLLLPPTDRQLTAPLPLFFPSSCPLCCREKEDVAELLLPLVMDTDLSMEVSSIAALSLALIYQGTANGDAVEAILQVGRWVVWVGRWVGGLACLGEGKGGGVGVGVLRWRPSCRWGVVIWEGGEAGGVGRGC